MRSAVSASDASCAANLRPALLAPQRRSEAPRLLLRRGAFPLQLPLQLVHLLVEALQAWGAVKEVGTAGQAAATLSSLYMHRRTHLQLMSERRHERGCGARNGG